MLKRNTPMRRVSFGRRAPPPKLPIVHQPLSRPVVYADIDGAAVCSPKDRPLRHEGYRRLVAALDCIHCGHPGPSQAAHADYGKGMCLKTDDRTCHPLCADSPGRQGCHSILGAGGVLPRDLVRELADAYGRSTRMLIRAQGLWPKDLPLWEGE